MFLPFTLSVAERHIWRFSDEGKGSKNQNSENEVWKIMARTEIERRYTVKKWERWGSEGQGDRETSPHSLVGKERTESRMEQGQRQPAAGSASRAGQELE